MKQLSDQDELMVRYLLGELSAEDRARFEDGYFADEEVYEQLLAVEDELIDAYAHGELEPRRRARFESHFVSTSKAERVEFAKELSPALVRERALSAGATPPATTARERRWWHSLLPPPARRPALALSLAALMLALLGGLSWLIIERRREGVRLSQTQTPKDVNQPEHARPGEVSSNGQTLKEAPTEPGATQTPTPGAAMPEPPTADRRPAGERRAAKPPPRRAAGPVVSFILSPNLAGRNAPATNTNGNLTSTNANTGATGTPSGNDFPAQRIVIQNRLAVPRDAASVRLQLTISETDEYGWYRATLETDDGVEVLTRGPLGSRASRPGQKIVTLVLPAKSLRAGGYFLTLSGVKPSAEPEPLANYFFVVVKE